MDQPQVFPRKVRGREVWSIAIVLSNFNFSHTYIVVLWVAVLPEELGARLSRGFIAIRFDCITGL
jgi:hypothetical protein